MKIKHLSKDDSLDKNKFFRLIGKLVKSLTAIFLILILSAFAYSLFLESMKLSLIPILVTTISIMLVLRIYNKNRRSKSYEYQFLWLMEYISTALSTGAALESILINAAEDIKEQGSGKFKDISQALAKLRCRLIIHLDLDRSLEAFISDFPCDSAHLILGNISHLKRSGGRIDQYIQDSSRMLREQIELIRSMEAEQSGKITETYIMALAPFFMAVILKNAGNFQSYIYHTTWGSYAMSVVYMISCCSALLALLLSSYSYDKYKFINDSKVTNSILFSSIPSYKANKGTNSWLSKFLISGGNKIRFVYKEYLPAHIWHLINSQLKIDGKLKMITSAALHESYFTAKFQIIILSLMFSSLLITMDPKLILLLTLCPIMTLLQDGLLLTRYRQRSSQESMRFPQWLNLMAILLNSGLSLQRSLQICCFSRDNIHSAKNDKLDYFNEELNSLQIRLSNGISPSVLINDLSDRCTILQIKYALELIVRYERDGGKEILGLYTLSAGSTWQVYRDELKKKLQVKNLLYLIPCGLSLASVIATAIIPAASMLMLGN